MVNNVIGKDLSKVQWGVCMSALLLATVLFFCPVISIPLQPADYTAVFGPVLAAAAANETDPSQETKYAEIVESFTESETSFALSGIGLVASLPATVKLVGALNTCNKLEDHSDSIMKKTASDPNYIASAKAENDLLKLKELQEKLANTDPSAVSMASVSNVRLLLKCIITMAVNEGFDGSSNATVVQIVAMMIITLFGLLILAVILILFPLKMLVTVIRLLSYLIVKRKIDRKRAAHQCAVMPGRYGVVLAAMVIWDGRFTAAGWLLTAAVAAVLAVNILASRNRPYTLAEKQFLNWMQICAAISLAGMLFFIICIKVADPIGFYLSAGNQIMAESASNFDKGDAVIKFLMCVPVCTAIGLLYVFKGIMGLLSGVACMKDPESEAHDASLGAIVIAAIMVAVNSIVMCIFDPTMSAGQKGAFALCFIGVIVALAGRILFATVRKVKMSEMTSVDACVILCGCPAVDQRLADESAAEASAEQGTAHERDQNE